MQSRRRSNPPSPECKKAPGNTIIIYVITLIFCVTFCITFSVKKMHFAVTEVITFCIKNYYNFWRENTSGIGLTENEITAVVS